MVPQPSRLAGPCDMELLAALHGRCFGGGGEIWDTPAITTLLKAPGVFAYLAVAGSETPVGLVVARSAGGESEILTIGILPAYRRRGHGLALIEAAASHAAGGGADSVFLEVAADNRTAQALYRSAGFRPVGRRAGYYRRQAGRVDAVILRRDLGPTAGERHRSSAGTKPA